MNRAPCIIDQGHPGVLRRTHGTFRGPQMIQDKAQFAVNGYSLDKSCNDVLNHLRVSLRARREAVICGVAPLGNDQPFPARRALQLTAFRHAESAMCVMQYTKW